MPPLPVPGRYDISQAKKERARKQERNIHPDTKCPASKKQIIAL